MENLKKENDAKSIEEGDFMDYLKRIGENKSVAKVMDFKPDYFLRHSDDSFDCVFFIKNPFASFYHLSKLYALKQLNCEFDFKKIIFIALDSKLIESKEIGIVLEKNAVNCSDIKNLIYSMIDDYSKKIGKKIELIILSP